MACFTPHSPPPLPTVAFDTDTKLRSSFTDHGLACAHGDARQLGRPNDGKADLPPPRTVLVPPPFSCPTHSPATPFSSPPILLFQCIPAPTSRWHALLASAVACCSAQLVALVA